MTICGPQESVCPAPCIEPVFAAEPTPSLASVRAELDALAPMVITAEFATPLGTPANGALSLEDRIARLSADDQTTVFTDLRERMGTAEMQTLRDGALQPSTQLAIERAMQAPSPNLADWMNFSEMGKTYLANIFGGRAERSPPKAVQNQPVRVAAVKPVAPVANAAASIPLAQSVASAPPEQPRPFALCGGGRMPPEPWTNDEDPLEEASCVPHDSMSFEEWAALARAGALPSMAQGGSGSEYGNLGQILATVRVALKDGRFESIFASQMGWALPPQTLEGGEGRDSLVPTTPGDESPDDSDSGHGSAAIFLEGAISELPARLDPEDW